MQLNLFVIFLAAAIQPTGAADTPATSEVEARYSPSFTACRGASMATADLVFCIMTEAQVQEEKLDAALTAALKRLPAKRKAALRSAQAQWQRKAAAACDEATPDKAFERVAEAERGQCMLDATIRRTVELESKH